MGKDKNKPRGKMTAYAYFVQTCREEHKKKHPGENVVFAEFSKKCAEKWKSMGAKEKKRFDDMSGKDKIRYEKEMANYTPPEGAGPKKRKHKKDPNAPKRALSAFFFFCNEFRSEVKEEHPSYGIGDIAKELAKRWEVVGNAKPKYEELARKDKARYEKEMAVYKNTGGAAASPSKKAKPEPKKKAPPPPPEDDDDDEEEEEEEDDDEEEEDDE